MSPSAAAPKKRGPPKGVRYGGRGPGSKNKATIERELRAAAVIDQARGQGRELAVDILERLMKIAEGAASVHKPPVPADAQAAQSAEDAAAMREGREPRQLFAGDWNAFGEWFDRTVYCAKELAKYQSPQIRAVIPLAPPPAPPMRTVEDAGEDDPVSRTQRAQSTYLRLVKGNGDAA